MTPTLERPVKHRLRTPGVPPDEWPIICHGDQDLPPYIRVVYYHWILADECPVCKP